MDKRYAYNVVCQLGYASLPLSSPSLCQPEIAMMLVECCSQERSYLRFFGLLGQVKYSASDLPPSLPPSLIPSRPLPHVHFLVIPILTLVHTIVLQYCSYCTSFVVFLCSCLSFEPSSRGSACSTSYGWRHLTTSFKSRCVPSQ